MKVFISSTISGMEDFREAAARGVRCLGYEAVRAEDFEAQVASPQNACLAGVRDADAVILILGGHYGAIQQSGLSATHEEYREARERCPVLVMVQDGTERDARQTEFLNEVRDWEAGLYTASFTSASQLIDRVVRALHEYLLANSAGNVEPDELLQRAQNLLAHTRDDRSYGRPHLAMALVGGPQQLIVRPAKLDDRRFHEFLQQMALFGDAPILDARLGTDVCVEGDILVFNQKNASFAVCEDGSILLTGNIPSAEHGLPTIIEEDLHDSIYRYLNFANAILDSLDPTNRISHWVPAVLITDATFLGWRTRAEHAENPNSMQMHVHGDNESRSPVSLSPPHRARSTLRLSAEDIAEDLTVKLRRRFLSPGGRPWR